MTNELKTSNRIVSLDQFRGYTVVGMLLVNYLGAFKYTCGPSILMHTHDYCSYADTIMPQFLFAVGFAYRLTFGRRVLKQGESAAYARVVRRILGLVLISFVVYAAPTAAETWDKLVDVGVWGAIKSPLKGRWFQTLMHIAATSLWITPVIRAGAGVRIGWAVLSALLHVWFSYWFNYVWVNTGAADGETAPFFFFNWAAPTNGVDGGVLGFLTWTVPTIVGTLACDAIAGATGRPPLAKLVGWSFVLMAVAWVMSCGTRMYDVPPSQREALKDQKLAEHPVFPPLEFVQAHFRKPLPELLAEPPFVHPPWGSPEMGPDYSAYEVAAEGETDDEKNAREAELERLQGLNKQDLRNGPYFRKWNYWMMSQRGGTLSYPLFCAGFSLLVYVLFYIACDRYGWHLWFFHWFGVNALLAYVLHGMVGGAVKAFVPKDAPGLYVAGSVVVYFAINYVIIRHFGRLKIFLRI